MYNISRVPCTSYGNSSVYIMILANIDSIGKEHKIKGIKPQRLYISCSRGDESAFRVNALFVSGVGLRIIKFQQHDCVGRLGAETANEDGGHQVHH